MQMNRFSSSLTLNTNCLETKSENHYNCHMTRFKTHYNRMKSLFKKTDEEDTEAFVDDSIANDSPSQKAMHDSAFDIFRIVDHVTSVM